MKEEIKDSEIRIIGQTQPARRNRWWWAAIAVGVVAVAAVLLGWHQCSQRTDNEVGLFEQRAIAEGPTAAIREWIAQYEISREQGCVVKDTTIGDIAFSIYLPLGAVPSLEVGTNCLADSQNIMVFQAADIRADNLKIVGAFVEKGTARAWGLSKQGYCAIIDNDVTIGKSDNSPLFDMARQTGGCFFRQFALVADGQMQHVEIEQAAQRRALCEIGKNVFVVDTHTSCTFDELIRLLWHIGVDNAIYLVGGNTYGWVVDTEGTQRISGVAAPEDYENINYIYWQRRGDNC